MFAAATLWFAAVPRAIGADTGAAASFAWMSYAGEDPVARVLPVTPAQYRNPIIPGFQPDPSIVRVRDDYYLVNSSFAFFPGLPIYHSRDLVNWEQLGNAFDRPNQFNLSGLGIARAIFAATIRWHDGMFYIVGTCVECGSNFLISASNPGGPWSDPVWLESVDGGVDLSKHPIWVEGPHLFKRDHWYYLIAAEGGTASGHSEVVFRSRTVTGPYVPGPANPILTQRDLDPARHYPVAWRHGWPQILPPKTAVPQVHARPQLPTGVIVDRSRWRDTFDSPQLSPDWEMMRTSAETWYALSANPGALRRLRGLGCLCRRAASLLSWPVANAEGTDASGRRAQRCGRSRRRPDHCGCLVHGQRRRTDPSANCRARRRV